MRQPIALALIASTLLLTLAGCGQQPAAPAAPPVRAAQQAQQPARQATAQAVAEGQALRDGVIKAFTESTGFEIEAKSYSEGYFKAGERVSALRRSNSRLKLTWAKPNKLRGEILETDNMLLEGGKMATTDGENLTVRARGFLGLFPIKAKASDVKMRNMRNHTFKDGLPASLMSRLASPTSQWSVIGDGVVEGTPIKLVAVDNVRRLDNEVTREILGVDPRTNQLRKVTMMAGNKKVIEYTFMKFRWNPKVTTEMFNL